MTSINFNADDLHEQHTVPEAPAEFYCPITCELMNDPLMSRTGQNFERHAILEWLQEHNYTCPMTRQPLRVSDLYPNAALQCRIRAWCVVHEVPLGNGRSTSSSSCHHGEDSEGDYDDDFSMPPKNVFVTCMISDVIKMPSERRNQSTSTDRSPVPSQHRTFRLSRLGKMFSSRR